MIGSSQEAVVRFSVDPDTVSSLDPYLLATICIVSGVEFRSGEDAGYPPKVKAARSSYGKCERCWNLRPSVGQDPEHPTLCERCARVVKALANQ